MSGKKIAVILTAFIIIFMLIAGLIGISAKLPLIGKALAVVFAVLLVIFVLIFFIIISKRKSK